MDNVLQFPKHFHFNESPESKEYLFSHSHGHLQL